MVYLAWDNADYYGPDFIGCYATLEAAKREVLKEANQYRQSYTDSEWEHAAADGQWRLGYTYHIDEVEPEA